MQIQPTVLSPPQSYSSSAPNVSATNVSATKVHVAPHSAVDAIHQLEHDKKSQGLENSHFESMTVNGDEAHLPTKMLSTESMTAELLSARLGAKLEYEQSLQGSEGAVGEYLANENAAAREQIQQMVGIDTYA